MENVRTPSSRSGVRGESGTESRDTLVLVVPMSIPTDVVERCCGAMLGDRASVLMPSFCPLLNKRVKICASIDNPLPGE